MNGGLFGATLLALLTAASIAEAGPSTRANGRDLKTAARLALARVINKGAARWRGIGGNRRSRFCTGLARPAGLEPATARLEGECSIHLS